MLSNISQPLTLEARSATVSVGSRDLIHAVDFQSFPGELHAIVGPNGAGKSTLLKVLSGDFPPSSGSIYAQGKPLSDYAPLEMACIRAVLPQQTVLQFGFTAREVVAMGCHPHTHRGERSPIEQKQTAEQAMRQTETLHLTERTYPTLSGGEQSRVNLARVLAQETPILLLDEPTASMDIRHQELVMDIARTLAEDNAAVIAIVHDLNLAARHADKVTILDNGHLRASGPPREVFQAELLSDVFDYPLAVEDRGQAGCLIMPRPMPTGDHRASLYLVEQPLRTPVTADTLDSDTS